MKFLYPIFLWTLLALTIPVLIHLLKFRRYKTIYFSNVRYLTNIIRSTKNRSRLKHIIIMTLRMLSLAALVFAFAMPYLPVSPNENVAIGNEVTVFIDNSFSMESVNPKGTLLEEAKKSAIQIVNQFPRDTHYYLFTNDYKTGQYYPKSKEEAIREISSIEPSNLPADFNKLVRAEMSSTKQKRGKLYVISDFQANSSDISSFQKDTVKTIALIPVSTLPTGNLFIDSCRFVSPLHRINQKEELAAWISNQSNDDLSNVPIKLFVNDSLTAVANFSIKAGAYEQVTLKFTNSATGIRQGKLIIPDFPVIYDNEFFLTWKVEDKRAVMAVLGNSPLLKEARQILSALLEHDPFTLLKIVQEDEIKISELPHYSSILLINLQRLPSGLSHELNKYANQGGNIILFPSFKTQTDELNNFLQLAGAPKIERFDTLTTYIEKVDFSHPIYYNVFYLNPKEFTPIPVPKHFRWKIAPAQKGNFLLTLNNRQPALFTLPVGNGNLSLFSFPLQHHSFSRHSLFVSTIYNLLFFSRYHPPMYHTIGTTPNLTVTNTFTSSANLGITNLTNGDLFYTETSVTADNKLLIKLGEQITGAGFYQIGNKKNVAAFNYNRHESDLRCFSREELQKQIGEQKRNNIQIIAGEPDRSNILEVRNQQRILWKWLLAAALTFLLLEGILLRFWR